MIVGSTSAPLMGLAPSFKVHCSYIAPAELAPQIHSFPYAFQFLPSVVTIKKWRGWGIRITQTYAKYNGC